MDTTVGERLAADVLHSTIVRVESAEHLAREYKALLNDYRDKTRRNQRTLLSQYRKTQRLMKEINALREEITRLITVINNQPILQKEKVANLLIGREIRIAKIQGLRNEIARLEKERREWKNKVFAFHYGSDSDVVVQQVQKCQAAKSKFRVLESVIPSNELCKYAGRMWEESLKMYIPKQYIIGEGLINSLCGTNTEEILRGWEDNSLDYYWVPSKCCGDSNCGGTINRANYLAIIIEYGKAKGVYPLRGDDGAYGIAISLRWLVEGSPEALKLLEKLTHFEVIDQGVLNHLEVGLIDEAWEDWGEDQFLKALKKKYNINLKIENHEEFRDFFNDTIERIDAEWTFDASRKAKIDIGEIVSCIFFLSIEKWIS